jgi:hypothetical protein
LRADLFGRLPAVGEQGAKVVARGARQESRQAREQVAEIGERFDVVAQARGNQAEVDCRRDLATIAA